MPVSAVVRVEQLGHTLVAYRDVGRNRGGDTADGLTGHDPEVAAVGRVGGQVGNGDAAYPRQRRGFGTHPAPEFGHPRALPLHLEEHGTRIVADKAGKA